MKKKYNLLCKLFSHEIGIEFVIEKCVMHKKEKKITNEKKELQIIWNITREIPLNKGRWKKKKRERKKQDWSTEEELKNFLKSKPGNRNLIKGVKGCLPRKILRSLLKLD